MTQGHKKPAALLEKLLRVVKGRASLFLRVGLGLSEGHDLVAFFELAALFEHFHTLESFQDVAFCCDLAGTFEAGMLRHKFRKIVEGRET